MALRVYYKNRIGWYTSTEEYPDMPVRKFKNWMCHANVDLWADMYFYKVKEDYEQFGTKYKKGDKMAQVIAFWCDTGHLKRALKDGAYRGADDFHFFADQMDADVWRAVKILVNAGKKVTIVKSQKKKKCL